MKLVYPTPPFPVDNPVNNGQIHSEPFGELGHTPLPLGIETPDLPHLFLVEFGPFRPFSIFATEMPYFGSFGGLLIYESFSLENCHDRPMIDSQPFPDAPHALSVFIGTMNLRDLAIFDLRVRYLLPSEIGSDESPMTDTVFHVVGSGAPSQVGEIVIGGNAVPMATFHPLGTRTDEGFENEPAHTSGSVLIVSCQVDVGSSEVIYEDVDEDTLDDSAPLPVLVVNTTGQRFNPSTRGDSVEPLSSWNVSPILFRTVGVSLNPLVQGFPIGIAFGHGHLPSWFPVELRRAGGRETAFRVYTPSPSYSMERRSPRE